MEWQENCRDRVHFTYKDVPQKRFTLAGQTFPEPSPYDRLILDRRVRFVGDGVAIIAGETEEQVDHAMRLITVKYRVLEPVLDPHEAKDGKILSIRRRTGRRYAMWGQIIGEICAPPACESQGDVEQVLSSCSHVIARVYHTKANQQGYDGDLFVPMPVWMFTED